MTRIYSETVRILSSTQILPALDRAGRGTGRKGASRVVSWGVRCGVGSWGVGWGVGSWGVGWSVGWGVGRGLS